MSNSKEFPRYHKKKDKGPGCVLSLVGLLLIIPLFIWATRIIPLPDWPLYLDNILLFIIIAMIVSTLLRIVKGLVILAVLLVAGFLLYGEIAGKYGFGDMYQDYRATISAMVAQPRPSVVDIPEGTLTYPSVDSSGSVAITSIDPLVNDASMAHFRDYLQEYEDNEDVALLIRSFSVYRELGIKWQFVPVAVVIPDSVNGDSLPSILAGNTSDYALFLVSMIREIGGKAALMTSGGETYPLLYIGKRWEMVRAIDLIRRKLFREESDGQRIWFHKDKNKRYWINLAVSNYPGAVELQPGVPNP